VNGAMLTLLSPAKDLAEGPFPKVAKTTLPKLLEHSEPLIKKLRGCSTKRLAGLMGISPKLAELNHTRFQDWSTPFTLKNATPAVFLFNGEAYRGLDARTLDAADLQFAQHHLRILSGLYGVLRPLDLIQPYRLEMGTTLPVARKKNLYAYWGDRISMALKAELATGPNVVVNLASSEYFKAVRSNMLGVRIVTPVFKDRTASGYKVVMVHAKHQRGSMARYIMQNRILDPEKLKAYDADGYRYSKADSSADEFVFLRAHFPQVR